MRAQARRCATVPLGHGLVPISFYRKRRLVRLKVLCFHSVCLKSSVQFPREDDQWSRYSWQTDIVWVNTVLSTYYTSFPVTKAHAFVLALVDGLVSINLSTGWVGFYTFFNLYLDNFFHSNENWCSLFSSSYQLYACYKYTGCPKSLRICYNLFISERRVY